MSIRINPQWQLDVPGEFNLINSDQIDFGVPLGLVSLPIDYLEFMKISDGAVLRDRNAWFIAHFPTGALIAEVDYLSEMENVISHSQMVNTIFAGQSRSPLPGKYIAIAASELEKIDILLCVDVQDINYGKIYAWRTSYDPWMEGENTHGLGLIANNFTDFMNNLNSRVAL